MNAPFIPAVASAMPPASGAPTRCADEAGAAGNLRAVIAAAAVGIPASVVDVLAKLDDRAVFWLLGELLEPSIDTPFTSSERLDDAMIGIREAYCRDYKRIVAEMGWLS